MNMIKLFTSSITLLCTVWISNAYSYTELKVENDIAFVSESTLETIIDSNYGINVTKPVYTTSSLGDAVSLVAKLSNNDYDSGNTFKVVGWGHAGSPETKLSENDYDMGNAIKVVGWGHAGSPAAKLLENDYDMGNAIKVVGWGHAGGPAAKL